MSPDSFSNRCNIIEAIARVSAAADKSRFSSHALSCVEVCEAAPVGATGATRWLRAAATDGKILFVAYCPRPDKWPACSFNVEAAGLVQVRALAKRMERILSNRVYDKIPMTKHIRASILNAETGDATEEGDALAIEVPKAREGAVVAINRFEFARWSAMMHPRPFLHGFAHGGISGKYLELASRFLGCRPGLTPMPMTDGKHNLFRGGEYAGRQHDFAIIMPITLPALGTEFPFGEP